MSQPWQTMSSGLQWEKDGQHWPHREASHFVQAEGLRWHTQQFGFRIDTTRKTPENQQPVALLIHGTGASTHSWRDLVPLLQPYFKVLAIDLPGHGFTGMPMGEASSHQFTLPGMAQAIGGLLQALNVNPALIVGHSAGAAIGARMCLDGLVAPQVLVSLNGAFLQLGGLAGRLFSPAAKFMAAVPLVPQLFSWRAADPSVLQKLIGGTGSKLSDEGLAMYGKLVSNPSHAAGALRMMANWDLQELAKDLPELKTPLCLAVGANDRTIPPRQAGQVKALFSLSSQPRVTLTNLPGLGHLAHEERPDLVAQVILKAFEFARANTQG
jgi:magnesium chelatase accessory protein